MAGGPKRQKCPNRQPEIDGFSSWLQVAGSGRVGLGRVGLGRFALSARGCMMVLLGFHVGFAPQRPKHQQLRARLRSRLIMCASRCKVCYDTFFPSGFAKQPRGGLGHWYHPLVCWALGLSHSYGWYVPLV